MCRMLIESFEILPQFDLNGCAWEQCMKRNCDARCNDVFNRSLEVTTNTQNKYESINCDIDRLW